MNLPGAISSARLPERLRPLLTLVNLHYAGAALLLLLNLVLGASIFSAWRATSDSGAETLAQQQIALKTAQIQARPLEGLDTKLVTATQQSDLFSDRRLPVSYSQVLTELGSLTHAQQVKLTRVQYSQVPVLSNSPGALTEVRMDATLTGDYRPLVLFLNSLERDRMFFLVSGLALTGQQGGVVGLRLRLTTYLRPGLAEEAQQSPVTTTPAARALDVPAVAGAAAATEISSPASSSATDTQRAAQSSASPASGASSANSRSSNSSLRTSGPRFTPPPGGPPEIRSANPPPPGAEQ